MPLEPMKTGRIATGGFSGAGFSLWGLVRAGSTLPATKPHRLKPAPLKAASRWPPGFSFSAPVPPLALFTRQTRIAGLCNARAEHVQHTDVLPLPGDTAQFLVEILRVLARQFRH